MSEAEIEELKRLDKLGTAAPWQTEHERGCPWDIEGPAGVAVAQAQQHVVVRDDPKQVSRHGNAQLIVAMRNSLPRLLEERKRLLEALRGALDDEDTLMIRALHEASRSAIAFAEEATHE